MQQLTVVPQEGRLIVSISGTLLWFLKRMGPRLIHTGWDPLSVNGEEEVGIFSL